MEKYLFCAEVDRIQHTLFRAARQRQVVGGSRLIAELGEQAKALAKEYGAEDEDILITAGGSFSILFPSEKKASDFGRDLADTYRLLLNASITIAKPKLVPEPVDQCFGHANKALREEVQRLKRAKRGQSDTSHVPTTAFCNSSGVGLAASFEAPLSGEDKQYLSAFARAMTQAGNLRKTVTPNEPKPQSKSEDEPQREQEDKSFLGQISKYLPEDLREWRWAKNVDEIMSLDRERANVAYLVADGNNMGMLFRKCHKPEQLKQLSAALDQATREAIAKTVPVLVKRFKEYGAFTEKEFLPLLPLILAGDDLFVLLPAKYALDFARHFCLAFEDAMSQAEIVKKLRQADQTIAMPTMGAAIIICKGHYPYHLAHRRGEELLGQAKRMIKFTTSGSEQGYSALAFDLLLGSELLSGQKYQGNYRPTLSPYWVVKDEQLDEKAKESSRSIYPLFLYRRLLQVLPKKRLAAIRELFASEALPEKADALRQFWNPRLQKLCERIEVTSSTKKALHLFKKALAELGNQSKREKKENPGHWYKVWRAEGEYSGHGLPDLIALWDYAQSFDWALSDYEEEGT